MSLQNQNSIADEVSEIYNSYLEVVQPLLIDAQIATGKFPVQVLNEARAILTHLARVDKWRDQDDELARDNCTKAKRHIKRAQLDCYKVLCLSSNQILTEFSKKYANVDLVLADNGQFVQNLNNKKRAAEDSLAKAWKAEADGTDEDAVFEAYETAYELHTDLKKFLEDPQTLKHLDFAVQMTDRNRETAKENLALTKRMEKSNRKAFWLTILSIALALVSIAEGIVIYFISNPIS